MSTVITDITHYDEFSEEAGGGVPQVNGNVGGKHISVIEGYFYRAALDKYLQFLPDGTVENINELDGETWASLGFVVGATVSFENTVSNNVTTVITALDGMLMTTEAVGIFVDETVDLVDVYDDTPVTCVDFYYNLIENSDPESYYSRTDAGAVQRFSATGFEDDGSGSDENDPINMLVASESFGWVTNTLVDEDLGETDQVRITNVGTTAHKQYFLINHIFFIAPFTLAEQKLNFENETPPEYLSGGRSLKYIARVDGNTSCGCGLAEGGHTGSQTTPDGCIAWFNQNNKKTRAEYYFDSITFADPSAVALESIDINKVVSVVITIKSRNGKFQFDANQTRLILAFTYLPLNTDRYIFTPDTLLRENFINDRCNMLVEAGVTAADFEGTDYQVLTNVRSNFVDVNTITVSFDVDFDTALKTLWESLPEENRYYFFSVMTQDCDISTTQQSDRVNVLCPLNQIEWDKEIVDLIAEYDGLHVIQFPETEDTQATENVAGYEGDPVAVSFPFTLLQPDNLNPTLLTAGFEIVATKAGMDDFVLEGKIFDVSLVRKLDGVQTISESETRDFKDMPDVYKTISLERDSVYDDVGSGSDLLDMAGFIAKYPFVLRYEYWAALISQAEQYQYEIFEEIETTSQSWDTLQSDGWVLQVKFTGTARAYADYIQTFAQYWDITVKTFGETPDSGPTLTHTRIFEDIDEDIQVDGILSGKRTRITDIWAGDFSAIPSPYTTPYAYIFADYNGGGINVRRFASSKFDSDADSPFSSEGLSALAGSSDSWSTDNVLVSIFGTTHVIMQTIYDDRFDNWTRTKEELLFPARLGFWNNPAGDDEEFYYYL